MARSKRDDMKRAIAQAMNHLAAAVLDVDGVQKLFAEHHPEMAEYLTQIEIATNANREALAKFAEVAWDLDEEGVMRYM